jgi:hypothetical protein
LNTAVTKNLNEQLHDLRYYHNPSAIAGGKAPPRGARIADHVTGTNGNGGAGQKHSTLANIHDKVWLEWDRATLESPRVDWRVSRIGYWGQCRALGIIAMNLPGVRANFPATRQQLAKEILETARRKNSDFQEEDYRHAHELKKNDHILSNKKDLLDYAPRTLKGLLQALLHTGPQNPIIPPIEVSRILRDATLRFLWDEIGQLDGFTPPAGITDDGLIEHLKNTSYQDPELCFWGIAKRIGLAPHFEALLGGSRLDQTGLSWLEPRINEYVRADDPVLPKDESGDIAGHVVQVMNCLQHTGSDVTGCAHIAVLQGSPFSGKRAVVGDFLRSLKPADPTGDIGLVCIDPRTRTRRESMPVLCLQTRDFDEISLSLQVLIFLERLDAKRCNRPVGKQEDIFKRRVQELERGGGQPGLQVFLDQIMPLHANNPALFIFMDVHDNSNTDIRFIIQRHSIRQLIETLFETRAGSRFLLTSRDASAKGDRTVSTEDFIRQHRHEVIPIETTTFARLRWYVEQDKLDEFNKAAEDNGFEAISDLEAGGNLLMLLAVLYAQPCMSKEGFFDFLKAALEEGDDPEEMLRRTANRLLATWHDQGLLPYILLILAADDGMMAATLETCVRDWGKQDNGLNKCSYEEAFAKLDALSILGRGLFLSHKTSPEFFGEEMRFDEPSFQEHRDDFHRYQLDGTIAHELRKAIWEDGNKNYLRLAYRLVACQSRSRARYRSLRGTSIQQGFLQKLPERSLQSFISLLLSLSPKPTEPAKPRSTDTEAHQPVLTLATPKVFSIKKNFDQTTAIQYAYYVVLKQEVDKDNALSMQHDADLLRMRLYTLLCANPGDVGYWDPADVTFNRGELPAVLRDATLQHLADFPAQDRSDVFTALGLSAFYTQQHQVLRWAEYCLREELAKEPEVAENLSRVIAARSDLEATAGHGFKREYEPKHPKTKRTYGFKTAKGLIYAQSSLKRDLALLCPDLPLEILADVALAEVPRAQAAAWLRLQPRRLLLRSLIAPSDVSLELRLLREIEGRYLSTTKQTRSHIQHGRTGRLMMCLESGNFPVETALTSALLQKATDKGDLLQCMGTLVHANVSRLRGYSGSERILTVLDHGRHLMLGNKIGAARRAVTEARRLCYASTASDTVRLETLLVETTILMAHLECQIADKGVTERHTLELDILHRKLGFLDAITEAYGLKMVRYTLQVMAERWMRLNAVVGDWDTRQTAVKRVRALTRPDLEALVKDHEAQGARAQIEETLIVLRKTTIEPGEGEKSAAAADMGLAAGV